MSQHQHSEPMNSFEQCLAGFAPVAPAIERDRLMFCAGQASIQDSILSTRHSHRTWLWPASTTVLAATSLALAFTLVFRPVTPPTVVLRDPAIPVLDERSNFPVESQPGPAALVSSAGNFETTVSPSTYLQTREVALRMGLDALGSPQYSPQPSEPTTYRDLWLGLTSSNRSPVSGAGPSEKQTTM